MKGDNWKTRGPVSGLTIATANLDERVKVHDSRATVLVTGGAGYVGSHIGKCLWHSGFQPVVLDNLSSGRAEAVQWGPLLVGDCSNSDTVRSALKEYRCSLVIHCAGRDEPSSTGRSLRRYVDGGTSNARSIISAMQAEGARGLVYLSTYEVYGTSYADGAKEDVPVSPVSAWGKLSHEVESLCASMNAGEKLRFVFLRLATVAGAERDYDLDEPVGPGWHFIANATHAAAGLIPDAEYNGAGYPTADGTLIRDYIHVADVGNAAVRALIYLLCDRPSTIVNIGTGTGCSEAEVLKLVRETTGRDVPLRLSTPHGSAVLVANSSRAHRLLHWTPHHSQVSSLILSAWAAVLARSLATRAGGPR